MATNLLTADVSNYLKKIKSIPMLTEAEEIELIDKWCSEGDMAAAQKLVLSHLRLVVKIAFRFKNYGAALLDLISEGSIGLMHAVKKFKPSMGCKLATYALWWIKATIQDYIIKSWSILKISTSAIKKKLFYNLNKVKQNINNTSDACIDLENAKSGVLGNGMSERDNLMLNIGSNVLSLDESISDENNSTLNGVIEDADAVNQETLLLDNESQLRSRVMLTKALQELSDREKNIIISRKLKNKPDTLEVLAERFQISRERVRQIEQNAISKLRKLIEAEEKVA